MATAVGCPTLGRFQAVFDSRSTGVMMSLLFRWRRHVSAWCRPVVASLVAVCGACANGSTAPLQNAPAFDTLSVIPDPIRDLPGTWMAPFAVPGSDERWTLALSGEVVSGTGTWSGEACCSGTVSLTGLLRGDSVHLDLVYTQTAPDRGLPPRAVHIDAVIDRPIDLVGVARDASGSTSPVRYVKSTAVSPAGAALRRLAWWNENVTRSVGLAADGANIYALSEDHVVSAVGKTSGTVLWQTRTTPGFNSTVGSGLAMVGGLLVVGDVDLLALDPNTGKEVWRIPASAASSSGFPFAVDGTTIFGTTTTGQVYAVDARTSATKWIAHVVSDTVTATETDVFSPQVANGVVYVAFTSRNPSALFASSGVAAVDENSGKVLWSTRLPRSGTTNTVISSMAVAPASVVAVAFDDSLHIVDRQTGQLTASIPPTTFSLTGSVAGTFPNLSVIMTFGNTVVVGTEGQAPVSLTALDAATLVPLWRAPFQDDDIGLLASDGRRAYAVAAVSGALGVYDLGTGQRVWQLGTADLRPAGERIGAAPVFDEQYVYLGGNQGLYALRKN
jgi:outer membrane protein assembly factor BamB